MPGDLSIGVPRDTCGITCCADAPTNTQPTPHFLHCLSYHKIKCQSRNGEREGVCGEREGVCGPVSE